MPDDGEIDPRYKRFVEQDEDHRTAGARDRDRVLYSAPFRRLANVTQVVSASETQLVHNRLTHSLKVAQIARRLAEQLKDAYKDDPERIARTGGIDPDVAETAGMAHDLGHPPFGHVAENELQRILEGSDGHHDYTLPDSFEGNAQTFRIVTKLAWRKLPEEGTDDAGATREQALNFTRASLNAILKYPWICGDHPEHADPQKWGAYYPEREEFAFARASSQAGQQSAEATLMDWADDIAYAVHDMEDFYRAGHIPLHRLHRDPEERESFITYATSKLAAKVGKQYDTDMGTDQFRSATENFPKVPYRGTRRDAGRLHQMASRFISDCCSAVTIASDGQIEITPEMYNQVGMLKELTWYYVIDAPALATVQDGQRRVIDDLFKWLSDAAERASQDNVEARRLPTLLNELLTFTHRDVEAKAAYERDPSRLRKRAVCDYLCLLTEQQAYELHGRMSGHPGVSVLEGWHYT